VITELRTRYSTQLDDALRQGCRQSFSESKWIADILARGNPILLFSGNKSHAVNMNSKFSRGLSNSRPIVIVRG
jgi:hypothetical protein